jgi:hypothetical protein
MRHSLGILGAVVCAVAAAAAPNLSISTEPYLAGGLFSCPTFPHEGQEVVLTVRAGCSGDLAENPLASLVIRDAHGAVLAEKTLTLSIVLPVASKAGDDSDPPAPCAEATWTWSSERNGLFEVEVVLDPGNTIQEENEQDNTATLVLPVIVKGKGRALHFPWYREIPTARWATCVTSTREPQQARLAERGVTPLNWEYGGMSWSYYDKEKAKSDPEAVLAEIEEVFYSKFTSEGATHGCGIDEIGGYPGSWKFKASVASMKGLVRAKAEKPDRFFAVWNGGGPRPELAALCRQGADLLLLETYLWRALPDELGVQDIYESMVSRIEPFIRATDMFQPAYGNHCYTLIALDTSERPDRCDLGELEQVVRFIRRRFPEMRGIAWYTGGYGNCGLVRTEETDRHHEALLRQADRLCFDYWVKPCITLMPECLWLGRDDEGNPTLNVAVTNLGSVDSGEVSVEFLVDGAPVGVRSAACVPAGAGRNASTVRLTQPVSLTTGSHTFLARIVSAQGATVLDSVVEQERLLQ